MVHTFGTYTFDDAALELRREGRRVRLEPQPAKALAALLARPGEVVTREAMRQAIWGAETHVDYDRGLTYCIGQVRSALGDSGGNPRFVETLPKRGFRFLAPVSVRGAADAPAAAVPPPSTAATSARPRWAPVVAAVAMSAIVAALLWRGSVAPAMTTVAVSIFDNETGDPGLDGFVNGLADVVVTRLTTLAPGRLGIIGNAAPLRQPRNIRNLDALAAALDADYVVLGQLQRQDAGVRVVLHVIRLADGVHLSAERLVRPTVDVAGLEDDVAQAVERAVRRHVLDAAPASRADASR